MGRSQFLKELLSLPGLSTPAVSPDGKWVAWTWYHVGPAAAVFVADTKGESAPRRMSNLPNDTAVVSWTPDSTALIVGADKDGDERVRLFRIDLDRPGRASPLTEASPPYFLSGGQLHPNGRWLVYGANYDFKTGKETEPTWVYRHDLLTGQRLPLARPLKGGFVVPDLNKQGTQILYSRNDIDPAGQQVWLTDIEGRGDREILNFGGKRKVSASWFPDGRRVLFLAEADGYRRLGVYNIETGEKLWLLDDPTRNIERAFIPENGREVVVVELVNAGVRCSLLDPDGGRLTKLPEIDGNLIALSPSADGSWVGERYGSRQPADLVRFRTGARDEVEIKSISRIWDRTALKAGDFAQARDYSWKSIDLRQIHGWLYRAAEPKGTIVYVHGGPTHHHEDRLDPEVQFYVRCGFNVLDPNYRGSTGYGLAFQDAIKEDGWGGREQDDIRTGIEKLIADGIASPGKVGMTGTSFGGYSSWFALTHWSPDIVAAAVPICGMTDLVVDYETTRPDLRPYSEEMMGGTPATAPERYRERSPIHRVKEIKGRLMIVQGLRDPNVTPEHVRRVEAELKRERIKYELLVFPNEGHGVYKPANERTLFERIVGFFAESLSAGSLPK